ncbi:MAG: carbohydrate porin [Fimbriimonadaceae bacterium]|nr:carbohydrate porin [Fimbriimonadaceae bacterium]
MSDSRVRVWRWLTLGVALAAGLAQANPREELLEHLRSEHLGRGLGCAEWWAEHGLDLELWHASEFAWNTGGGLSARRALDYVGYWTATALLDTGTAGWWPGGQFYAAAESYYGRPLSSTKVGDYWYFSNLTLTDNTTRLAEAWYRQDFGGRGWLQAGLLDASWTFGNPQGCGELNNSSAWANPAIPLPVSPVPNWGALGGWQVTDRCELRLGLLHNKPGGPFLIAQPVFGYTSQGQPGRLALGAWWNGGDAAAVDPADPRVYNHTWGLYANWDQRLWAASDAADEPRGLDLWASYAYAKADRAVLEHFLAGGATWSGPLRARPADALAFGAFHLKFSPAAGLPHDAETTLEVVYRAQLAPWLQARFDAQYIISPSGADLKPAKVVGVRLETLF